MPLRMILMDRKWCGSIMIPKAQGIISVLDPWRQKEVYLAFDEWFSYKHKFKLIV